MTRPDDARPDDDAMDPAMRYAHDVGFDEGWQEGYEEGFSDGVRSVDAKPCSRADGSRP